ncbi:hypothetical protein LS70_009370 [Helicobacter sp. MIT 11-5569]|uniref:hypothetical protein n=1 Tax=Helicobacter sp. MIT 11-5569 TaxID=1548151 RepID=UPI0010FD5639|nr:hypothetical protein [Helicobacter sp. MIT 11-5569]TLD80041.1 hypothetical protein LS70_009370 [Helicobacter sp. MIT 11-5569]
MLVVFRDPISIAKTYANHLGYCRTRCDKITLACDCFDIFDYFNYTGDLSSPHIKSWRSILKGGKIEWSSVLNNIPKETQVLSLDTQDIMPNRAFFTLKRLT